jgi:peptide/nickel transport system permease protein
MADRTLDPAVHRAVHAGAVTPGALPTGALPTGAVTPGAAAAAAVAPGQLQVVARRFLADRAAVAGLVLLLTLLGASLVGGRLWTWDHTDITPEFSTPPSAAHPMGTDGIGHDTLAQVLRGAQKSVQIALLVAVLSVTVGTAVGALAGYYRGWVDAVLMRLTDVALAVPQLALLVVVSGVFGRGGGLLPGWVVVALAIAALAWTTVARVVRAELLSLREREFVQAARALGAGDARIILRHLLPCAAGPVTVNATVVVAAAIMAETALSYLGVGVRPPDTSLGLLVQDGQQAALTRPWLFAFPGAFTVAIVLAVNFVGEGLRQALDPRGRRGAR